MKKQVDTIVVFTSKSLGTMVQEGGSGNWHARKDKISKRCKWIVAVRNRHSERREGDEDHGTAFLIGKISAVRESHEQKRIVVEFSEYAKLDIADFWDGQRNPVKYVALNSLSIDLQELKWLPFPRSTRATATPAGILEQAKELVAKSLAIPTSAVKITVTI
jgi:hypothetical protein